MTARTRTVHSGRCWLDWWKNRQRYVQRLVYAPVWTDLLPTASDDPACIEERVEQTRSADKTVQNSTWLLFYVPSDLEFQPGRVNAACRRIHRMLASSMTTTKAWEITTMETQKEGSRGGEFGAARQIHRIWRSLRHCTSFTRCSAAGVATWLELRGFFGPLVSDTRAGERKRRRRESVPGVGPLAN